MVRFRKLSPVRPINHWGGRPFGPVNYRFRPLFFSTDTFSPQPTKTKKIPTDNLFFSPLGPRGLFSASAVFRSCIPGNVRTSPGMAGEIFQPTFFPQPTKNNSNRQMFLFQQTFFSPLGPGGVFSASAVFRSCIPGNVWTFPGMGGQVFQPTFFSPTNKKKFPPDKYFLFQRTFFFPLGPRGVFSTSAVFR